MSYPNSRQIRAAWMQLAECSQEKGDRTRAIEIYKSVLRKFPRTPEAARAHTVLETTYHVADTEVSDR
jgi:TolA-binding protein